MKRKSKNETDVAARAAECRRLAENACIDFNDDAEQAAVDEFEAGEVAEYFRKNAQYATGLVVRRLESIREGKPTFPFHKLDADEIVRLLSTCTLADYDAEDFDENLSDERTIVDWESGSLVQEGYPSVAETPSTHLQETLRYALTDYARAAAAVAKRIHSPSLDDWAGIIDILENCPCDLTSPLDEEDARRLIALHVSAANRLRIDQIIASLPTDEKAPKKPKKAK